MHPTPPPTGDPGLKRKRAASPGPSSSKKNRPLHARRPKSKRPSSWHMKREDVPEGAGETKVALELHLRILWQLPDQSSVPPKVTDQDIAPFNRRFSSESEVKRTVVTSLEENSGRIHDARTTVAHFRKSLPDDGIISNNIKRVDEPFLLLIFRSVAMLGLRRWAPDVLSGDPESFYNLLHEHVALKTFEQVSAADGYAHTGINRSFVHDFPLMRKLYRNFVYGYMYGIVKSEEKNPGSVAKSKQMGTVWKRRSELTKGRVDTLKAQGFNERVVALAMETEAHSDDELGEDVDGAIYYIKEKEGRSAKVKQFFRMADIQRRRMARAKRKHNKTERRREEPEMPRPSDLTAQPTQVPIDWFDPTYWNTYLTVRERADYIRDGIIIALPVDEFCGTWEQCAIWKNLPQKEFMATYGDTVLKQYNLPTAEEMAQLEEWENDEDVGDNNEDVNDPE